MTYAKKFALRGLPNTAGVFIKKAGAGTIFGVEDFGI